MAGELNELINPCVQEPIHLGTKDVTGKVIGRSTWNVSILQKGNKELVTKKIWECKQPCPQHIFSL